MCSSSLITAYGCHTLYQLATIDSGVRTPVTPDLKTTKIKTCTVRGGSRDGSFGLDHPPLVLVQTKFNNVQTVEALIISDHKRTV